MMHAMRIGLVLAVAVLAVGVVIHGESRAAFPGDNGKIGWASARDGNVEIYAANPDGSALARLTTNPATDTDPAWSADGTRIAFTSNRGGSDDIFLMAGNGSGQTRLTTDPASDVNPSWSPGGRNVVFVSNRDGDAEIWAMNEDGSGQAQLTSDGASDATPAWSPDGRRIAFLSERDGNSEIYAMNVDGSAQTRLTASSGSDVSPNWSPDGSQIAFASDRDGTYEIYVMNADGSNLRRMTTNLETDLDPAWSPDGKKMAFTTNRDGNNEIYVMDADGSRQTRFTAAAGEDTTSDWQPVPVVPQPPKPIDRAFLEPRWHESEYRGELVVRGEVPGPSRLRLVLRRGNAVRYATRFLLPAGSFRRELTMPRNLLPGRYILDVTAPGSPTLLTPQALSIALQPPPEGVASRAWASDTVGGPAVERFPSTTSRVWAHFKMAAQPKTGRVLTAAWYGPGYALKPKRKPKSSLVISFVNAKNDVPLPRGVSTCVLRAGPTVVKRVSFRVG
jgi:Tol biopolymer transport system component